MNQKRNRKRSGGAMFTTVLVLAFIVPMAVGSIIAVAHQQVHMSRRVSDRIKAKAISESGANQAYGVLSTNFAARTNGALFVATSFAGGDYDANVRAVGTEAAVICATGRYGSATARTIFDVKNYPQIDQTGGSSGPPSAFDYIIVAGDLMNWSGGGMTRAIGKVHTNGKYYMGGNCGLKTTLSSCLEVKSVGTTLIDGDASAPDFLNKSPDNITGTATVAPVPLVEMPDIDLTPYYLHALAHGEAYSGNRQISGSGDLIPNGGIMWVNGDLKIAWSGRIIGCFMATGDINVTGSGQHVKVAGYPAFVSRDGDVDLNWTGNIHGLIYAKYGNFEINANAEILGTIICAGTFTKGGYWEEITYEPSIPVPPGGGELPVVDLVVVEAWQE